MYVPNPQKWIKYYDHIATGGNKQDLYQWEGINQTGGSISSHGKNYMIPIEKRQDKEYKKDTNVTIISPFKSTVNRAESEVKRTVKRVKQKRQKRKINIKKKRRTIKRLKNKTKKSHKRKTKRRTVSKKSSDIFDS